jgi:hypothetical protein
LVNVVAVPDAKVLPPETLLPVVPVCVKLFVAPENVEYRSWTWGAVATSAALKVHVPPFDPMATMEVPPTLSV